MAYVYLTDSELQRILDEENNIIETDSRVAQDLQHEFDLMSLQNDTAIVQAVHAPLTPPQNDADFDRAVQASLHTPQPTKRKASHMTSDTDLAWEFHVQELHALETRKASHMTSDTDLAWEFHVQELHALETRKSTPRARHRNSHHGLQVPKSLREGGWVLEKVPGDGNCFFHSVALMYNRLPSTNTRVTHQSLRQAVADWLVSPPVGHILTRHGAFTRLTSQQKNNLRRNGFWSNNAMDVVPIVLSEIYNVNIVIYNSSSGQLDYGATNIMYIPGRPDVHVCYTGSHYDGVCPRT